MMDEPWVKNRHGSAECRECGALRGKTPHHSFCTHLEANQSDAERIASLEAQLAALRKVLKEYVAYPCRVGWGTLDCQEHSPEDCLTAWAKNEEPNE